MLLGSHVVITMKTDVVCRCCGCYVVKFILCILVHFLTNLKIVTAVMVTDGLVFA